MELARALGKEKRPQRTVVFALWGSEEAGLVGARYFLKHPTFPLQDVDRQSGVRDDRPRRSEGEAGRALADRMGAHQPWAASWRRTARNWWAIRIPTRISSRAPTISRWPGTASSRRPSRATGCTRTTTSRPTAVDKIDWQHLDSAIGSMIGPVSWLANSDFTPQWNRRRQKP